MKGVQNNNPIPYYINGYVAASGGYCNISLRVYYNIPKLYGIIDRNTYEYTRKALG